MKIGELFFWLQHPKLSASSPSFSPTSPFFLPTPKNSSQGAALKQCIWMKGIPSFAVKIYGMGVLFNGFSFSSRVFRNIQ